MEQPLENQSGSHPLPWPNILDALSAVGVIGGSIASLVSGQVALAAFPISLSVALNIANRRRLMSEMTQTHQSAIANLSQLMSDNQVEIKHLGEQLGEQLGQVEQGFSEELKQQSQTHQTNLTLVSEKIEQLQQLTAEITQDTQSLNEFTQSLEAQQKQLEEVVGELRQIENCSQAIRTNPSAAESYYQRGLSHQRLGNRQGAINDYTQALQLDPGYAKAYHNRGILNAELGQKKKAVEDLRQAAKFYFEQGDIDSYQQARDLSKEFYNLRHSTVIETEKDQDELKFEIVESLQVGSLFSDNN